MPVTSIVVALCFGAEDFDGTPLLATDATVCADVTDLLKDGRGNPIPVVSRIAYDRSQTDPALGLIEVIKTEDARALAQDLAGLQTTLLSKVGTVEIRGDDHLCAVTAGGDIGCLVANPYASSDPVIVLCEDGICLAPAIAMTDQLFIRARWPLHIMDASGQAADLARRVGAIAAFLAPISSGL